MFDFIRTHQLNIMLGLSASCMTVTFLVLATRFLTARRKAILILMESNATLLLFFDRMAYVYSGNTERIGYIMVRLSNFLVFFLTIGLLLGFNLYIMDYLSDEGKMASMPKRLLLVNVITLIGFMLAVISHFTGLYYYFDANNVYHRGNGFLIAYIIPVVCPIIQYSVIVKYRKLFRPLIFTALSLYLFVPLGMGILQIFTYGLSIVNMSMVLVSLGLYLFTYLDVNNEVIHAHELEMEGFREERKSMKRLFEQTAKAFVTAIEKKHPFLVGRSERVAILARNIAKNSGKSDEMCDEVYYSALLNDVGLVDIPNELIGKEDSMSEEEDKLIKSMPVISSEILSGITVYPFLSESVKYTHERYDGTGYPEGLKGDSIPDISKIISVAGSYDYLTNPVGGRGALPEPFVREELIKEAGGRFDPEYAKIMLQMMDADTNSKHGETPDELETELKCGSYRDNVTNGIPISENVTRIRFRAVPSSEGKYAYSAPSIILFDAYDRRVHDDPRAIQAYRYLEYGELWFDGHKVVTGARTMQSDVHDMTVEGELSNAAGGEDEHIYEIIASRYEDHLRIVTDSAAYTVDTVVALPDRTKAVYVGITGENCDITEITVEKTDNITKEGDIPRIADEINFIDRIESDIPNVQIDRHRSASTVGIPVKDRVKLYFHTMSLPSSSLVWHCPYIVLYYSDDATIGGPNYREYSMIKVNGESDGSNEYADNDFVMNKGDDFRGWEEWRRLNKEGMETEITLVRKGSKVTLFTTNCGISITNITTIKDGMDKVYVALTGDEIALTDIRIR